MQKEQGISKIGKKSDLVEGTPISEAEMVDETD